MITGKTFKDFSGLQVLADDFKEKSDRRYRNYSEFVRRMEWCKEKWGPSVQGRNWWGTNLHTDEPKIAFADPANEVIANLCW